MDFVFLDTSVFIKYNYLEGNAINSLFNLSKSKICKLTLTTLVKREIIRRYSEGLEELSKTIHSRNFSIVKNTVDGELFISKFQEINHSLNFIKNFNKVLFEAEAEILDIQYCNLNSVLDSYFEYKRPFSKSKKNEFSDAISLNILENYFNSIHSSCLIFTTDPDLLYYKSDVLQIHSADKLPEYVIEKNHELDILNYERVEYLKYLIEKENINIKQKIERFLLDIEIDSLSFEILIKNKTYNKYIQSYKIDDIKFDILQTTSDFFELTFHSKGKLSIWYSYYDKTTNDKVNDNIDLENYELDSQVIVKIPLDDFISKSEFQVLNINFGDNIIYFFDYLD